MTFREVPVGSLFWYDQYEMYKVDEDNAEFSGDVDKFPKDTLVGVLEII